MKTIVISMILFSCTNSKKVKVWGFAYNGDEIILKKGSIQLMNFKAKCIGNNENICSLNEELTLLDSDNNQVINVIINSNSTCVLDTFINVHKENMEPFISIEYPKSHQRLFNRTLFVADATNRIYIKY